jgi:hypothetical protein
MEECENDVQGRRHWVLLGYFFSLVTSVMGVVLRPRLHSSRSTAVPLVSCFSCCALSLCYHLPFYSCQCLCTPTLSNLPLKTVGGQMPHGRHSVEVSSALLLMPLLFHRISSCHNRT